MRLLRNRDLTTSPSQQEHPSHNYATANRAHRKESGSESQFKSHDNKQTGEAGNENSTPRSRKDRESEWFLKSDRRQEQAQGGPKRDEINTGHEQARQGTNQNDQKPVISLVDAVQIEEDPEERSQHADGDSLEDVC
jgi:hypothetical protein